MTVEDLENAVLQSVRDLTRDDVAELAGVPEEQARALWTAMGLAEVPAGARAFSRADAEALRLAVELRERGVLDPDTVLVLARPRGQSMSRLAESQVAVFRSSAKRLDADDPVGAATALAGDVLPALEQIVVHVWRRQLASAAGRSVGEVRHEGQPVVAVGFVDLVDYTRTSRTWDARRLERLLEQFERDTALRVTATGGRVVKTLGDAVLYVCEDVRSAAEVALATVRAHAKDPGLPLVRAGIALGPVLARLGDVFGSPVNLASRLSEEARPGTVLLDAVAAEKLQDDPGYVLDRLHARHVRGYRFLRPYRLRLAERPARGRLAPGPY